MFQIVKEILEHAFGYKTRLVSADHLKFLSVISPREIPMVLAEVQYTIHPSGEIEVNASLLNETTTFFKFRGVFIAA